MKTKWWAIALMVVCTAFTSSAQILYKMGADNLKLDFISLLTNFPLIGGLILYGLGAILVIISLRGGSVTVLYPIITSSYIWVSLASSYVFGDSLNVFKGIGMIAIIIGILIIAKGDEKNHIVEFTEPV